MIHLFRHFVPARLVVLAVLEGLFLLLASYAGIYFHPAYLGSASSGIAHNVFPQVAIVVIVMMTLMASMGLYKPDVWSSTRSLAVRISVAFGMAYLLMEFVPRVTSSANPSSFVMGATLGAALLGSFVLRTALHEWSNATPFKSRVLVLGSGARAMTLLEHVHLNSHDVVVGCMPLPSETSFVAESNLVQLNPEETLSSAVERMQVDKIVIAVRERRGGKLPIDELLKCKAKGIAVMEMPSFFEREYRQILLESLNPSWMVLSEGFQVGGFSIAVKRVFDLSMSAALLLIAWPVMLVTALCISIESKGPILYRQERVGKDGRVFNLLKFRSMRVDAEQDGMPQWAKEKDDRTTIIGKFIRKVRIDELPQIFNVLRGEMSFVGPRPERPFFVNKLSKQIPYYGLRHSAKPGITGWAQIRYPYGATVEDAIEKLQYDLYYIKNHSLFLDLMILISTIEVVLWGKGGR